MDDKKEIDLEQLTPVLNSFAESLKKEILGAIKPAADTKGLLDDLHKYKSKVQEYENSDVTKKLQQLEEMNKALALEKEKTETTYKSQLHNMLKTNVVTQALNRHQGSVRVLEKELLNRLSVAEVEGKTEVVVLDQSGNPMLKDKNPATIDDLVEEYKSDTEFAFAFKSVKRSGTGLTNTTGGAGEEPASNPFVTGNKDEQYRLFKTDKAKFERLKQEAATKS